MDINNVFTRQNKLQALLSESEVRVFTNANQLIEKSKNPNINIDYLVNQYLQETKSNPNIADFYVADYVRLMEHFCYRNRDIYNKITEAFSDLVMASKKQDNIINLIEASKLDNTFKSTIKTLCENNIICDRVAENDKKIRSRFTLKEVNNFLMQDNTNDELVTEAICELVSSYNMPIFKRINVALEETLLMYSKYNKTPNKNTVVETTLDYFLSNNEYLTDRDIKNITHVFESNPFIEEKDLESIKYFLHPEEELNAYDKLIAISNNMTTDSYKKCIVEIANSQNLTSAKVTIKRVINTIFNMYVINNISSIDEAMKVYDCLFSLTLVIGTKPTTLVDEIYNTTKSIINTINPKDDDEAVLRKERISKLMIDKCKAFNKEYGEEVYIEAGLLLDSIRKSSEPTLVENKTLKESTVLELASYFTETNFNKYLLEAELVDSCDVKKALDSYKLKQAKDANLLVRTVRGIYAKKPKNIIDDTPHILGFIRKFGILGTFGIPHIGPICALVLFIADYSISQSIERKEADKVLKHFRNEEKIVNNKLEKMSDSNPNRKALEKYSTELHKAVLNLEEYRDNLYSEKEQDRIHDEEDLFESTLLESTRDITLGEYFEYHHKQICDDIDKVINGNINQLQLKFYNVELYKVEEFKSATFTSIKDYISPTTGNINVPVFIITMENENEIDSVIQYIQSLERTNKGLIPNSWLSIDRIGPNMDGVGFNIQIIYNHAANIDMEFGLANKEDMTIADKYKAMNIMNVAECISVIEENKTVIDDLISYIPELKVNEHLNELAILTKLSGLNETKLYHYIEQAAKETNDVLEYCNLMKYIRTSNELKPVHESIELQASCVESLAVIKEALSVKGLSKKGPKDTVEKKAKVTTSKKEEKKSIIGNISNRTKDGKLALTTNLGLAIEAMKKDIQKLSTKEKELSTTIDSSLSYFKRNIEKAIVSDRREAIIKGSIIPSFSKAIKTVITAGIAFKINPILGAIGCIGALACSKALTEKERKLLLDEIDIELKVVDREIENLGNDGSSQKYRQLITYKKQLMRESQRIRYRIKVYSKQNPPPMGDV